MSGLDKIISRLEASCSSECEKLIKEAELQAEKTLDDARLESEKISAEIIAQAQKQTVLLKDRASSASQSENRRAMLEAKVELIDETLEAALKKLRSLDSESYFAILRKLAENSRQPGEGQLLLSAADFGRMPADFAKRLGVTVAASSGVEDGFILKYGDIEINCGFKSLLNASREELKATAGNILFA